MKKLNYRLIKGFNWVLAGFLSLLGFSCDSGGGDYPVEYGVPNADFQVSGKVTNEAGKSLSGIRVVVPEVVHVTARTSTTSSDNPVPVHDTIYTSSDGTFLYRYIGFPTDTICVNMTFEDASVHPIYQTQKESVLFLRSDLRGGKGWNQGTSKKELKIRLKNK